MYRKSITKRHFGATYKYLVLSEFQVDQSDEGAPVKKRRRFLLGEASLQKEAPIQQRRTELA